MEKKEFIIAAKSQREWGLLLTLDLFLNGTGAGLFLLALVLGSLMHMVIGLVLVFIATVFLFIELSKPSNVWRIILRPGRSWISRGAIGIFIFFVMSLLYITVLLVQKNGSTSAGAMALWELRGGVLFFGIIAGCAAVYVATYHGFLLASMKSVPLWSNKALPALFLVYAILGGLGILFLFPFALEQQPLFFSVFPKVCLGIMVLGILLMLSFSPVNSFVGKKETAGSNQKAHLSYGHIALILVTSILFPMVSILFHDKNGGSSLLFPLSGMSLLLGAFLLRYILVKAASQRSAV